MSAYKSDGIWRYRIVVRKPDGSKIRISGTPEINTKAAALTEERLHVERVKTPTVQAPVIQSPEFAAFAGRWLDRHAVVAGNKSSTVTQRESHLRMRLTPFFTGLRLDQITTGKIAELQAVLMRELKPASAYSVLTALGLLLKDAVTWGELARLPEFPKAIEVPKGKKEGFTDDEQARLLAACEDEEERLELIFALDTGARAGEQLGIQWGDVDFVKHKIWIRRQRYAGETRETKTGIERSIDMTKRLERHLLDVCPRASVADKSTWIFPGAFSGRPRTYSHLAALMKKLCAKAGVKHTGWHKLRHTFASRLINRKVPAEVIQRWLGHASISQTLEYSHMDDEIGAKHIRALDDSDAVQDLTSR